MLMRAGREERKIPRLPILHPVMSLPPLSANGEKSKAQGALPINWEEIMERAHSLPLKIRRSHPQSFSEDKKEGKAQKQRIIDPPENPPVVEKPEKKHRDKSRFGSEKPSRG